MKRAATLLVLILIALLGKAQMGMTLKQINKKYGTPDDTYFDSVSKYYYTLYYKTPPIIDGFPEQTLVCVFRANYPKEKCIGVSLLFPDELREPISKILSSLFIADEDEFEWYNLTQNTCFRIIELQDKYFALSIFYLNNPNTNK